MCKGVIVFRDQNQFSVEQATSQGVQSSSNMAHNQRQDQMRCTGVGVKNKIVVQIVRPDQYSSVVRILLCFCRDTKQLSCS